MVQFVYNSKNLRSRCIPNAAFTTSPSDIVVARGDSVLFDCVFTSSVTVSVNWQNGGRVLSPSSKYMYLANNSLVITTTEDGDDGEYSCVVTNQLTQQTSSQSATLTFACECALSGACLGGRGEPVHTTNMTLAYDVLFLACFLSKGCTSSALQCSHIL